MWDTSVLPTALEKIAICHLIVKSNQHWINMLKLAWFTFDRLYPDGPRGVVNALSLPCVRNHSQPRKVAASVAAPGTANTAETCKAVAAHDSRHRQKITNMRMAPIDSQFTVFGQWNDNKVVSFISTSRSVWNDNDFA